MSSKRCVIASSAPSPWSGEPGGSSSPRGAEFEQTAAWYDERSGLGPGFVAAVGDTLDGIVRWPEAAPAWLGSRVAVRRARVRNFPYHVVYLVYDTTVWVLAVAHDRR